MKTNRTLLDCEYFPCIEWYRAYVKSEEVLIEQYEHFEKATFRNRCEVTGPNGKITLSVPLEKGRKQRSNMKDVKICNKEQWQQLHWKTLCASYRRAPYFEYYEEYFNDYFKKKFAYLLDLNLESIELINQLLKIKKENALNSQYEKNVSPEWIDMRSAFSPKHSPESTYIKYIQNFEERHGFLENLSILDLIFSCGPQSEGLLKS